jgi:CMP-N-acetylneuraminic acid synthetase
MDRSDILITICARGGSKGVPGKNIKNVGGKPLIAYTIEQAKEFSKLTGCNVVLSTDSEEIKSVAKLYGLDSDYQRPSALATDKIGKMEAILDILHEEEKKGFSFSYVIDLDVTSPLRRVEDISNCLKLLEADKEARNVFSVSEARKNPYFTLVEKAQNGYYALSKKRDDTVLSRQAAPAVYELNGSIYVYRRSFLASKPKIAYSDRSLIYEMPEICFDVDEPIDLEFLDFLINSGKVDFMLP